MAETLAFADLLSQLEQSILTALGTYSNVHRGSGHFSLATTQLYEEARNIVLEYLGLNKLFYTVIFCSPLRASAITSQLKSKKDYRVISSLDLGLPLGLRALAVRKRALRQVKNYQSGGGTTRLVSREWVVWADPPDRFEAGTPPVINVIAFAKALRMIRSGDKSIKDTPNNALSAHDILYKDELTSYSGRELLGELPKTLIGRGITVPTTDGPKLFINLDNAASTPTFQPILEAFCRTWRQSPEVQQEIVHEVRSVCSEMLRAPLSAYDVIFTSNTTEAVNLVAESIGNEPQQDTEPVLVSTILEHSSNDLPWRTVPGWSLIRLPIDDEGFLDTKELENLLDEYNEKNIHGRKRVRLFAVTGVSNVLGIFNDINEISRIVHKYGVKLMVDAAQWVAHRKVDMEMSGIDFLAFSAHKVYAPFGTGVLVARKGLLNFTPEKFDLIRQSGEENPGGIAALGKSLVLLERIGMDVIQEEEQLLTLQTVQGMEKIPGLIIYGIKDFHSLRFKEKGGIIVFSIKGSFSPQVANPLYGTGGIGVRYGCHCAHILIKHMVHVSPGLERLQHFMASVFPVIRFPGLVRISLGIQNTSEEMETLIQELERIERQIHRREKKTPRSEKAKARKEIKEFVREVVKRVYN